MRLFKACVVKGPRLNFELHKNVARNYRRSDDSDKLSLCLIQFLLVALFSLIRPVDDYPLHAESASSSPGRRQIAVGVRKS